MLERHRLSSEPNSVAELGPGDSLGVGLAALITGTENYYALDVTRYANTDRNLSVFDELVAMFQAHASIPHDDDLTVVKPYLDSYAFPEHILTPARLQQALRPERLTNIRANLTNPGAVQTAIGPQI
ncbi:MAG TPA: hypothetical protein PKE64_19375 [Anaerolineae bacterium]|nr:hypothetical protein [Anaerolineae bacterium]